MSSSEEEEINEAGGLFCQRFLFAVWPSSIRLLPIIMKIKLF